MPVPITREKLEREIDIKTIKRQDATREFRKLDQQLGKMRVVAREVPYAIIPVPATKPESLVWDMLRRMQLPFEFQYKFPDIEWTEAVENFRPDFMLPDYKVIILEYLYYT